MLSHISHPFHPLEGMYSFLFSSLLIVPEELVNALEQFLDYLGHV